MAGRRILQGQLTFTLCTRRDMQSAALRGVCKGLPGLLVLEGVEEHNALFDRGLPSAVQLVGKFTLPS